MRLTRPVHIAFHVVTAVLMCAALACTSTSLTGPDQSAPKCQVGVTAPQNALAPGGGSGTITIVAAPECQWVATSPEPWITGLTPASGQGPSQVSFSVGANPAAATRQGDISVNGSVARVNQDPAPCTFEVTPRTLTVASATGTGTVTVTTPIGCTWTSASEASWLTITSPAQRTSAGPVTFDYAENLVALPRIGSLTIAGVPVLVTQQAPGCTYVLTPATQNVVVGGAPGTVAVTAGQGCAWTASSNVSWLTVSGSPTGSGPGVVSFTAATNTGSPRTGQISVAGTVAAITQDGVASCQFSINPNSQAIGAGGGSGSTALTATPGCSWSVSSNAPWIALTSPSTGVSSSTVTFSVGANSGAARQGTLAVAGQTYTVNQAAAACAFNVTPTTQDMPSAGGATVFSVVTASHCAWTAAVTATNSSWIQITSGASDTGTGGVNVTVGANPAPSSRSGTLTVAGQTVTMTQNGATCTYGLDRGGDSVGAGSGTGAAITLTASHPACTWSAVANASWLHITSAASGSGTSTVTWTHDANGGGPRSGSLTIGGRTFTVSQGAGACTYGLDRAGDTVGSASGTGAAITLTATHAGCAWTAAANDSWLHLTSAASGSGGTTVTWTYDANGSGQRAGSFTIAGQTFTVTQQAANCSYGLSRAGDSVGSGAGAGGNIALTATHAGCGWTASANDSWLQLTSPSSGSGSATVTWTYDANTGGSRSGSLTVAGQTFTVMQAAANCAYGLDRAGDTVGNAAGTGAAISLTTTHAACGWVATSNASWLQVTSAPSGSGNATVTWTYDANTGAQRQGTFSIGGQTFTVTQDAAACSYTLAPTGRTGVLAAGESATVIVTTNLPSCGPWTAVSNDAWLTVDSVSSGTGSGSVAYTILPNGTMAQRTGSLTIAGQAFSVTQEP